MPLSAPAVSGLLARGMLCGILAGLCAFFFAHQIGEPQIERAIAFEAHARAAAGQAPEAEIFSRSVQSGLGLLTATVTVGMALGGLTAIGCALAYGRLGSLSLRTISLLVAGLGFVGVALAPGLKYPANPPAVGVPATIGVRTELFFAFIALSLCCMAFALLLGRMLAASWGAWNASVVAALAYLITVFIAQAFLPNVNEVPRDFPATALWAFRVASLQTQAVLWGMSGVLFGFWCGRADAA